MEKLDADFGALVKAALITSVQELVNDTPYATIAKHAESIVANAKVLPSVEEFQGDNSMLTFSHRLEKRSRCARQGGEERGYLCDRQGVVRGARRMRALPRRSALLASGGIPGVTGFARRVGLAR